MAVKEKYMYDINWSVFPRSCYSPYGSTTNGLWYDTKFAQLCPTDPFFETSIRIGHVKLEEYNQSNMTHNESKQ